MDWVAISFSKESSWTRDQTYSSYTAGGLLNCRWILHQLSHQGSPTFIEPSKKLQHSTMSCLDKYTPLPHLSLKNHLLICYLWSIHYILQRAELYLWSHRWENNQFIPRVHLPHDRLVAWASEWNRKGESTLSQYTQVSGWTRNSGEGISPTDRWVSVEMGAPCPHLISCSFCNDPVWQKMWWGIGRGGFILTNERMRNHLQRCWDNSIGIMSSLQSTKELIASGVVV